MAKRSGSARAPEAEADVTAAAQETEQAGVRPPQGITIRYMETGDPKLDFHPYQRQKPMIDPASLVVDGKHPMLAIPSGPRGTFHFRRIHAKHAAPLLTCDWATGNAPGHRLATDAEVAEEEAREQYRREHGGKNPEPE